MYITHISLKNFQKHETLELDLSSGFNVIHGASDAGKSTIIRAIKWVLVNEPKGDSVIKEGTKNTSVKLTLDNGVEVERVKNAKKNAYILHADGKSTTYEAINKTIPEDVQRVLQIRPFETEEENILLNIAGQMESPFLMEKSGIQRMKIFNKLTGADIADKVIQSFNKDLLNISRQTNEIASLTGETEKTIAALSDRLSYALQIYSNAEKVYQKIESQVELYSRIKDTFTRFTESSIKLDSLKSIYVPVVDFDNIKKQISLYNDITNLHDNYLKVIVQLKVIKNIKVPEVDTQKIRQQHELYANLDSIRIKIIKTEEIEKYLSSRHEAIQRDIVSLEAEKANIPVCPTCRRPL